VPDIQSTRTPSSSLRAAAWSAAIVGAAGSLDFWGHAAESPPLIVAILFVIWVGGPFMLLLLAHRLSTRWPPPVQTTLYVMMVLVTIGTLAFYADEAVSHRWAHPASVYVAIPAVSVLITAIVLVVAALRSRDRQGSAPAR
jgi:hypothetical protein